MNITFLIGNGFDIGVGMKSKFKDFFPIYKDKSVKKPDYIRQLSENIEGNYGTWANFEKELGVYTANFDKKTKQHFIQQIKDFEKEFISYLKEQEELLIFDKEVIEPIIQDAPFSYYSENNLPQTSSEKIANIYAQHRSEQYVYKFINFNYTSVLEKCLNAIPKRIVHNGKYCNYSRTEIIGDVIHIHGYKDTYPIIGVNDVSQIKNTELANDTAFARRIVKPLVNQYLRNKNDANATSAIEHSRIICVYGMSLGDTDKKWWDKIIQWLAGDSSRDLVIFDYDENYSTETQFDWLDKEDAIIERLSAFCSDNRIKVENLRSRIHIAIHKNIFGIKLKKNKKDDSKKQDKYLDVLEQIKAEETLEKAKKELAEV